METNPKKCQVVLLLLLFLLFGIWKFGNENSPYHCFYISSQKLVTNWLEEMSELNSLESENKYHVSFISFSKRPSILNRSWHNWELFKFWYFTNYIQERSERLDFLSSANTIDLVFVHLKSLKYLTLFWNSLWGSLKLPL